MRMRRVKRTLPWALFVLVPAVSMPGLIYDSMSDSQIGPSDLVWVLSLTFAFPILGAILTTRFPRNPVGWLFIIGPLLIVAGVSMQEYGEAMDSEWFAAAGENFFSGGLIAVAASLLLFPDGRYPTTLFKWVHWLLLGGLMIVTGETADGYLLAGIGVLTIGGFIYRLVTGGAGTRREMKPLVFVLAMALVGFFVVTPFLPDTSDPSVEAAWWVSWAEVGLSMVIWVGIPVAIAAAIMRYRLYEIDRLIARTISYALIVAGLALAFAAVAVWIPQRFGVDDPVFVAGATLAVAAIFNPVRRAVQTRVDRRFNRARYDSERVLESFAATLKDRIDPDEVLSGWVGAVSETMNPVSVAVWVKGS